MDPQERLIAWLLAGVVAAPILFLVGLNTAELAVDLSDPCTTWGEDSPGTVQLDEQCPRRTGHSTTRLEAVVTRIGFDGMAAFAAVGGLVAVGRQTPVYAALGTASLLFIAVPLFLGMFGLLAVLFALALLVLARWIRRRTVPKRSERPVARAALGILLALAALVVGIIVRLSPNPMILGGLAIAAGLGTWAAFTHWPRAAAPASHP